MRLEKADGREKECTRPPGMELGAAMRNALWIAMLVLIPAGQPGLKGQTRVDMARQGKNVDFAGAEKTRPFKVGNSLPAECEPGEVFFKTNEIASQAVYVCGPENSWTAVGRELPGADMTPGKVLVVGESGLQWKSPGGDIGGTIEGLTVRGLQGRAISSGAPSEGDVLRWSAISGMWEPRVPEGQYDAGVGVVIADRSISVDAATVPRYSTGFGPPTGGCEAGAEFYVDLSTQRLYFCAAANSWRAVARLGEGVTWGDISGQLSNQTDLWEALGNKADTTHAHDLAGDVRGPMGATTVTRIQGRAVSTEPPSDGQALVWDQSGQQWKPGNASGGTGSWDPMDTATLILRDDFCAGGTSSGQIGALGWSTTTIAGTAVSTGYNTGSANTPCILMGIGVSSTNPNDGKSLYLVNPTAPFHNAASAGNWEAKFVWYYQTSASELRSRVGLVRFDEPNVLVPSAFMGMRVDTDSAWEPTGTNFIACVCNGNTKASCTDIDTGVAVTANTTYKLHIWSDSPGVIRMRINDGSTITFSNPSTLPGSTVDFQPAWIVGRSGGTGSRQAYVDFFAARVTGLGR